jgi:TonB family protein
MEGAFGAGETANGNEGTASSGAGNQGSIQGNAPTGSYVGVGGYGGFDLAGRTLAAGGLPRPAYSVQEEGKIVINITVDPQGKVISAEIGRGTNITNPSMRNSALEAAGKTKFNSIKGNNNQSGTITYNYRLN